MRVIVLASQKGGSGKTTLSGHLAVQAELAGAGPVALIDTDPQGSLAKWWNAREAATPAFVQARFDNLGEDLQALRDGGFETVVIDTPPAVTHAIAQVVEHADLVVLPTRPSPHDLRAVGATVEIAEALEKSMIFVINAATARARITSEAAVALSQHGTVAPVTLHHRVDFAASMTDGRTVMEFEKNGRSAKEVRALWDYLSGRLKKLDQGPVTFADPFAATQPVAESPAQADTVNMPVSADPQPAVTEAAQADSEPEMVAREVVGEVEPVPAMAIEGTPQPDSDEPENPQQALIEAVQRLRGTDRLGDPITLMEEVEPDETRASRAADIRQLYESATSGSASDEDRDSGADSQPAPAPRSARPLIRSISRQVPSFGRRTGSSARR